MNSLQHDEIVRLVYSGEVEIGVDRANARKFYTDTPNHLIQSETGETPYLEKAIVSLSFLLSPILLLLSFGLAVPSFRYWALIAIPASALLYILNYTRSSMPGRGLILLTLLLLISVFCKFANCFNGIWIGFFCISLTLSLWLSRFMYIAATYFLKLFCLRNKRALEYLRDFIHLR